MNELIVKYKVGTCHYIYSNHILNVVWVYDKVFCVAEWTRFEWSRRIQLQFASNRIIIGSLEAEIQPVKCCSTSYAWSMTSRYVIGLLPVQWHAILSQFLFVFDCRSISVRHTSFQSLSFHTDVVRGGSLLYIAPAVSCAITPLL